MGLNWVTDIFVQKYPFSVLVTQFKRNLIWGGRVREGWTGSLGIVDTNYYI